MIVTLSGLYLYVDAFIVTSSIWCRT